MKYFLLVCCLSLFSFSLAFSQSFAVDQGAVIISGMASYSSQGGDLYEDSHSNRYTMIMLAPIVNYFVAPNISLGGAVAYTSQSQGDNSYSSISLGPTIGFFIGDAASTSYPYIAAGYRYSSMGDDNKITGSDIVVAAGVIAPIRRHAGVTIEASYHMESLKGENASKSVSGNMIMVGIGVAGLIF
jgi:hypothetical protein